MLLYILQSLVLGILLGATSLSRRRPDMFISVYVCVWTLTVILIYWHFGISQNIFYSNDQLVQIEMVQRLSSAGIHLSVDKFISERYVVTIPAYLLTKFGLPPILALKFVQGFFFVLMYRSITDYLVILGIKVRIRYLILIAGPLSIFISVLALRDVVIAFFAVMLIIRSDIRIRLVCLMVVGLLRPHLAISLLFGKVVELIFKKYDRKPNLLAVPILAFFSFLLGSFGYRYGLAIHDGIWLEPNPLTTILTKQKAILVLANFIGMQFLTFDQRIVNFSYINLVLLRLIFLDTLIIPILFVTAVINSGRRMFAKLVAVFSSFIFFIGLVSQSDFNSSRQNLPFLLMMGVLVIENIQDREEELLVK